MHNHKAVRNDFWPLSKFTGMAVFSTSEQIGEVKDAFIDPVSGALTYILLSIRTFGDIDDKLVLVHWPMFVFDREERHLRLTVAPEILRSCPSLPKDEDWGQNDFRDFALTSHKKSASFPTL